MIDRTKIRQYFGLALKKLRVINRYSLQELSDLLEININTLIKLERGEQNIKLPLYLDICSFFNVGLTHFLPDEWEEIRKEG